LWVSWKRIITLDNIVGGKYKSTYRWFLPYSTSATDALQKKRRGNKSLSTKCMGLYKGSIPKKRRQKKKPSRSSKETQQQMDFFF
jgi:hypothetical protein